MPAQKQDKQRTDDESDKRQQVNASIGQQVLHTLAQPGEFQRVQVRHLWDNRYRVNVLVGADAASVRVSDSYFLVTDSEGAILACTPPLPIGNR